MTPRVRRYAEEAGTPIGLTADQVLAKVGPRQGAYQFLPHPAGNARRAVMLRLRGDGFTVSQIGRWFGIDASTVSYWTRGCGRRR